jgi:hypothetical protein
MFAGALWTDLRLITECSQANLPNVGQGSSTANDPRLGSGHDCPAACGKAGMALAARQRIAHQGAPAGLMSAPAKAVASPRGRCRPRAPRGCD